MLLEFRDISKAFFGVPVLKNITLALDRGRILGLVGENGAGKSTLMNILGGVHQPDAGAMLLDDQPYAPKHPRDAATRGVAFIHQELNLFANLTIAENLHVEAFPRRRIAGVPLPLIDRLAVRERTRTLLDQVELQRDPDTPISELSPGERQLAEIAKALGAAAKLVILDEPTTSLTAPEAQRLFDIMRRLRERGVAMIYISHRLADVLDLCDDIAVLRDGQVVSTGPRSAYDEPRMIREMVGRNVEQLYPSRQQTRSERVVLVVENLARPPVLRDISFKLHAGEILGVAGLMGAGRTELARALFGVDPRDSGSITVNGESFEPSPRECIRRGLAFLTEDRRLEGLMMEATVLENASLVALPRYTRTPLRFVDGRALRDAALGVTRDVHLHAAAPQRQAARTLSGGNQQKVVLAKWLLGEAQPARGRAGSPQQGGAGPSPGRLAVLILDEPTRGIDVAAKAEVYQIIAQLAAKGTAVLMISSEIEELIGMCDRIMVMAGGTIVAEMPRAEFNREHILRAALQAAQPAGRRA